MPQIELTSQLARHAECPCSCTIEGSTLAEVFDTLVADYPKLNEYLTDNEGAVHAHLAVFVDGQMLEDRGALDQPLKQGSEVFVMQAISGG